MRGLLFIGRVAFICNLFFLLSIFFRFTNLPIPQSITGFIIVIGLLAPLFCLVFNLALIIAYYRKKIKPGTVPKWLVAFNLIMMIVLLITIPFL